MKAMIDIRSYDYHADMMNADFTQLLKENLESKERFYKIMGSQGRVIIPVELEQEVEALNHLVSKFTRSLGITLYNEINTHFSYDEIVENRLTTEKTLTRYELTLGSGMKFTKALSKIMEKMKYSMAQREKVINDYSLVLNEKKLKGILVLSVNPIDFLTMSWSDNWSSCLSAGGEYESGTMSYAIDTDTVLAFFISSKDEEALKNNKYVNKKWRKMLILSDSMVEDQEGRESILASKGYPYDGPMLTDEAVKHLSILLYERNMVKYEYEKVYNRVHTSLNGPGYSDIGLRNKINVYSLCEDLEDEKHKEGVKIRFIFGKAYDCIHCNSWSADAEAYACPDCGGYESCEDCGDAMPRESGYYTAYGYMICECCLDNDYAFAQNDDELYSVSDLTWIENGEYFVTDSYAAKNCVVCKECKETFELEDVTATEKGTFCDDCLDEAVAEEEEI